MQPTNSSLLGNSESISTANNFTLDADDPTDALWGALEQQQPSTLASITPSQQSPVLKHTSLPGTHLNMCVPLPSVPPRIKEKIIFDESVDLATLLLEAVFWWSTEPETTRSLTIHQTPTDNNLSICPQLSKTSLHLCHGWRYVIFI